MKVRPFLTVLTGSLLFLLSGNAQTIPEPPSVAIDQPADSVIFEKVEIEASFPGGETAWRRYLEKI